MYFKIYSPSMFNLKGYIHGYTLYIALIAKYIYYR